MADIEEIRKKIDRLISQCGLNYRDVSLKIGRKDSYIQQYVKYGYPRRLKEMDRIRLARLLNVDDAELMDDEIVATKANSLTAGRQNIISDIINSGKNPESNLEVVEMVNSKPDDCNTGTEITGKNLICRSMLTDFGFDATQNIKIAKIVNDAMKPTINPGDYVWFDAACKIPESNGLYLFLTVKKDNEELKKRTVEQWFAKTCEREIGSICREIYRYFEKYNVEFPQIRFRSMVSRWGSCQAKRKVLTFNLRLIEMPKICVEYVVLHEFVHFLQANHSKRFYALMTMFMPDWKERAQLLEKEGIFGIEA